jgi:hypothetical protein
MDTVDAHRWPGTALHRLHHRRFLIGVRVPPPVNLANPPFLPSAIGRGDPPGSVDRIRGGLGPESLGH